MLAHNTIYTSIAPYLRASSTGLAPRPRMRELLPARGVQRRDLRRGLLGAGLLAAGSGLVLAVVMVVLGAVALALVFFGHRTGFHATY
jgi:hypothetical protein